MNNNENASLDFLFGLEMFGIKLGLENIFRLLDYAGNPQKNLKFIHVAGTNGKGSVCAMLSAALKSAGFKTGFYSSPHLVSIRERFRVNGKAITIEELCGLIENIRPVINKMRNDGLYPTFFEVTTALAIIYFAREKADFVIWETGMGGRLDATNAVDPLCSIITGISLEHQQYLGETIEKIAAEKAGIIKPGRPVFCAVMDKAAEKVITETAAEKNSPVHIADSRLDNLLIRRNGLKFIQSFTLENFKIDLSMPGEAQRKNFKLAFAVLRYLSETFNFNLKAAFPGLSEVKWPARFQQVPDGSIIDGAHNPEGAEYLVKFIEEYFPGKKFSIVFGNFADKATEDILGILKKIACEFIFVPLKGGGKRKCQSGAELAVILSKISDLPCSSAPSLDDVFNGKMELRSDKIFAGSLYLAGEVLSHYFNENEITDI